MALDGVVEGPSLGQGYADHAARGLFRGVVDRLRHLARLARAVADPAATVTGHHQGGEAEPAATLDHLRHAVDGNELLDELAFLCPLARRAVFSLVDRKSTRLNSSH